MVRRALAQPASAAPGSVPSMPPEGIRHRILEAFISRGIGNTALADYRPRASSAGGCERALTYHRLGIAETDPLDPDIGLTLELGTLLHVYLDAVLVEYGLPVEIHEHELRVPFAYGEITGHFDRAIGGTTIVDYKSASRASFDLMVEANAPLPAYRPQVNFYLHGAKLHGMPYSHGLVVAYCKDPGVGAERTPWVSPPLPYDPDLAHRTVRLFEDVERHARANQIPERPYTVAHEFPCKGCRWRSRCWDITTLATDRVVDLANLEEVATRYDELRCQVATLKAEQDSLGGRLKAALIDQNSVAGTAGGWDLHLHRYERTTVDPDLVPPEVRKAAGKTTLVGQLSVTPRKDGKTERTVATGRARCASEK